MGMNATTELVTFVTIPLQINLPKWKVNREAAAQIPAAYFTHGCFDAQSDSPEHQNPGRDFGQRDQSRPDAAICRAVHGAGCERSGLWVSQFAGAASGNSDHAQRASRRR